MALKFGTVFVITGVKTKFMITKEDIENAIRKRIDRFNRLWKKDMGYTFEEEPEIEHKRYEREMAEYQPKVDARAKELGFETEKDYMQYLWDNHIDYDDPRRDPVMKELWKTEPKSPSALYDYDMSVINEAKRIAFWFIDNFPGQEKEKWLEFGPEGTSSWDFVKNIQAAGYNEWSNVHSGNSGSMSVRFAYHMIHDLELFVYEHGALCYLVGDKGYHDDRSDVHEIVERWKKEHGETEE